MLIRIDDIQFLLLKNARYPLNTPRRLEKITDEFVHFTKNRTLSENLIVDVGINLPDGRTFEPLLENVSFLLNNLPRFKVTDFEPFGKDVLLPLTTSCCGRKLRLDTRHSSVRLYTKTGITISFYYHGNCIQCKSKFYHNFTETTTKDRNFIKTDRYFVCTSSIGFSNDYLDFVTLLISIGSTSFKKISNIYNAEHNLTEGDKLRPDVLENNWLVYRISKKIPSFNWKINGDGHCDIEKICQQVYPALRKIIDEKWINHQCNEVGCNARMVVVDGNEKLYRYCCSEPIEKITNIKAEANIYNRCTNNPVRGNSSTVGSKKCLYHTTGNISGYIPDLLDIGPLTRSRTKELKFTIVSGEGCKEQSKVNKYDERTAGMLYLFRSCGIRISHFEMYTAESLSLVYSSLIDLFYNSNKENMLSGVVYDRACDLQPYIHKLSKEGNHIASYFMKMRFVVDIFHAEKHTQPKCDISKEECKYHPDLECFSNIRKMNMEVCEQGFHLLNCYKHITRNMTYGKRLCLLKLIDDDYNSMLEQKLF